MRTSHDNFEAIRREQQLLRLIIIIQSELKHYVKGSYDQELLSEIGTINSNLDRLTIRILEGS